MNYVLDLFSQFMISTSQLIKLNPNEIKIKVSALFWLFLIRLFLVYLILFGWLILILLEHADPGL